MMDPDEFELRERRCSLDMLQFGLGAGVALVGVLMMITIALMPLGLIVFFIGAAWVIAAAMMRRTGTERLRPHAPDPIDKLVGRGPH
ncbi:MAG: hypothetical protein H7144_06300 [Burkholderiales bacterium]|nr:hypothetical protein [Phycisphaerae bacterium]